MNPESYQLTLKANQLAHNYTKADVQKAKEMYERIIFEFPSSIYLVESRKSFRRLRGDAL